MNLITLSSPSEQVANHLREEILRGVWSAEMPGAPALSAELGIDRKTITAALNLLEEEGLLVGQGRGKSRKIAPNVVIDNPAMRIAILRFESTDRLEIDHLLPAAGHTVVYPPKALKDLNMDLGRVASLVEKTKADAWIVIAASGEVLRWFAERSQPVFALCGRRHRVKIASVGPETTSTIKAVSRRLIELGHRRVVMLSRKTRRVPEPAQFERAFLAELESQGCPVGGYNLPDWEETSQGLLCLLDSLFKLTPPTALIIHEVPQFVAVLRFLAIRGIRVPEDVSMICTDPDKSFSWCDPPMAHIRWDFDKATQRVVQWAGNVNGGKDDRVMTDIAAEFVEGGTVGPAPK